MLQHYVVEETTGNNKINNDEMRKLLYSRMNQVNNEVEVRFSHQNTKLRVAASAFQHENGNFLDVKTALPLLDLVDLTSEETEFDVAETYVAKSNGDEKTKLTTAKLFLNIVKHLRRCLLYISH